MKRYPGHVEREHAGEAAGGAAAQSSLRERGADALGELAQAILDNPLLGQALSRAAGASEKALAAQRSALAALNVASGSDLERLEQRLRSLSNRLEEAEDELDRLREEVRDLRRAASDGGGGP